MRSHLHRSRNTSERGRRCRSLLRRSRRLRDRPIHHQLQGPRRKEHSTRLHQRVGKLHRAGKASTVTSSTLSLTRSFLREGTAIADFLHPDRIVVGADSDRAAAMLQRIYLPLTSAYYTRSGAIAGSCSAATPPPLLLTSTKSAEIIKHASNAFLARKISFINAVSNLCEAANANVEQVARGMGLDSRIGAKFLRPGIGYGGSCFPKDVAAFRSVADQLGVDFNLLVEVERINDQQKERFLNKVRSAPLDLRGKRIGVGLALKGETVDIRELAHAIEIVEMLLAEGCSIAAYDPAAIKRTQEILPSGPNLSYVDDAYAAAKNADALLFLTDWEEFRALDFERLKKTLRYPIVIDGRNLCDPDIMAKYGFTYLSIGRPAAAILRGNSLRSPLPDSTCFENATMIRSRVLRSVRKHCSKWLQRSNQRGIDDI